MGNTCSYEIDESKEGVCKIYDGDTLGPMIGDNNIDNFKDVECGQTGYVLGNLTRLSLPRAASENSYKCKQARRVQISKQPCIGGWDACPPQPLSGDINICNSNSIFETLSTKSPELYCKENYNILKSFSCDVLPNIEGDYSKYFNDDGNDFLGIREYFLKSDMDEVGDQVFGNYITSDAYQCIYNILKDTKCSSLIDYSGGNYYNCENEEMKHIKRKSKNPYDSLPDDYVFKVVEGYSNSPILDQKNELIKEKVESGMDGERIIGMEVLGLEGTEEIDTEDINRFYEPYRRGGFINNGEVNYCGTNVNDELTYMVENDAANYSECMPCVEQIGCKNTNYVDSENLDIANECIWRDDQNGVFNCSLADQSQQKWLYYNSTGPEPKTDINFNDLLYISNNIEEMEEIEEESYKKYVIDRLSVQQCPPSSGNL